MDSESWLLSLSLFVLVLGGAYFAIAETAFASSNIIRIRNRAENGSRQARDALFILEHFDKALSTLLIGNNIMHIGIAALATLLATRIWGTGVVAYSTLVTTAVIFLVSEMVPKSFAGDKPESVALFLAGSLRVLMKALTPLSALFNAIAHLFSRMMGDTSTPSVTEDELYDIIESVADNGSMAEERSDLIHSALEFGDTTAEEVLTARVSMVGVEIDMDRAEILAIIKHSKFARLPVYKETLDSIVGVLSVRRFITNHLQGGDLALKDMLYAPYFVPRSKPIEDLFQEMGEKQLHMAVVTDDYGGTMGIVTMEDILEELVGEIWDETDVVREDFKILGGNRYEVSGDLSMTDALAMMDSGNKDYQESMEGKTTGAWAQENIADIPRQGSSFTFGRVTATVKQIDQRQHILKMVFTINPDIPGEGA
jgi:CBS domain containing-hemolysin-like protein